MKNVFLVLAAILFNIGGFLGGVIASIYSVILAIYELIQMANGNQETTMWAIFMVGVMFLCRGILISLAVSILMIIGMACGGAVE